MTLIKDALLAFIGLAGGVTVAAGVLAFITMLGIVPRLASRTGTAKHLLLYEDFIMLGGILGSIIGIFHIGIPMGIVGLGIFGLFSGIFVGCLAMALAETLNVIPIFTKRIRLVRGISYVILAIALGKGAGAFYQLFVL